MNVALELFLSLPAIVLLAIAFFFFIEVAAAVFAPRKDRDEQSVHGENAARGPVAIIIPAHNESANLKATLEDVTAQMRGGDKLIVVADNCDDDTASVARAAGAQALERSDHDKRGKGYALQFALDWLKTEAAKERAPDKARGKTPAAVFFIDADCRLGPGALDKTVAAALRDNRPAQALYMMNAPSNAPAAEDRSVSPKFEVAAFAWLLINKVRMSGLAHLFGFTRLTGAGMALPWGLAADLDLASGEIVEDLALTVRLMNEGAPPVFVGDALVASEFPSTEEAAAIQRARWEHGSMRVAKSQTGALLARGLFKGDMKSIAMAMDLSIPPLTVFTAVLIAALAAGALLLFFGAAWPLMIALAACALFAIGVAAAWLGFGREALPPATLGAIIPYIFGKRRVYGAAARKSTKTWTRTKRDGGKE